MLLTTDTALARRALEGDRQAFARIYEQSFACVWGFSVRRIGSRRAAERLTERILMRAFAELGDYDGAVPFAAWLLGVARRVVALERPRAVRRLDGYPLAPRR